MWAPFDGFAGRGGLMKGRFTENVPAHLNGYGTEEFKQIAEQLDRQAIPERLGVDVGENWGRVQKNFEEQGVKVESKLAPWN